MTEYLTDAKCPCGKLHKAEIDDVIIGSGAIKRLPEIIGKYSCEKAFILADINTFSAAGSNVCMLLEESNIKYSKYVFNDRSLVPDERAVGSAVMHFDASCDIIIGIGSGVINDIAKILSKIAGRKYIIVATAPSMDGYASPSSSMIMDNLKISIDSRCADTIIGDTDILKNAPMNMLQSGLGDMLAKYTSIAEWRIGNLISGEYYCEAVADLVRTALKKCSDNAIGLLDRDDQAVEAVFEGLIISGIAMAYAGISRPASGVEHYFSHIWDMRELEFSTKADLHGIQCAVGTYIAVRLYEKLKALTPNKEKATAYVSDFSLDAWHSQLKELLGNSALPMIELEKTEQKYDKSTHSARFDIIAENWDKIVGILTQELPTAAQLESLLTQLNMPMSCEYLGYDKSTVKLTFEATKDVRNKYILSRLAWDLGVLAELCEEL